MSNNTIISRTSNAGTYFDGLYFYQYSEVDTIKNNKINTTKVQQQFMLMEFTVIMLIIILLHQLIYI